MAEIAARRMFPLVIVKVNIAAACSRGQKYPGFYKKVAPGGTREMMLHLEPRFGQKSQMNDTCHTSSHIYTNIPTAVM